MLGLEDEKQNQWQRLENLLETLRFSSLSRLSKSEVKEFGELYRRAAADLAIARAESRDPRIVKYLNSLVIRAHGEIYRAEGSGRKVVGEFIRREFPRTFRRNLKPVILAFLLFTVFGVVSFLLAYRDVAFADAIGVGGVAEMAADDRRWWLRLNEANELGSTQILANNILVAFKAFAYGALFGIGTVYVLVFNGLHIGAVLGVCYAVSPSFGYGLTTFMVAHGVIELSCIFIAGGAGMLLGYSLIDPGDMTRSEALKKNGVEAAKLAVGCAALLFIAGFIEGFLSPSSLPSWLKYGTGIVTGIAMYSYLFLAGREEESDQSLPLSFTRR